MHHNWIFLCAFSQSVRSPKQQVEFMEPIICTHQMQQEIWSRESFFFFCTVVRFLSFFGLYFRIFYLEIHTHTFSKCIVVNCVLHCMQQTQWEKLRKKMVDFFFSLKSIDLPNFSLDPQQRPIDLFNTLYHDFPNRWQIAGKWA